MRNKIMLLLVTVMVTFLFAGCNGKEAEPKDTEPDAMTSASVATDEASLKRVAGKDGEWIAIFKNDITVESDLIVEGEFTNKEKVDRKFALYAQDEDRNTVATYTLTAPKLIVRSENFRLQGGNFVGDVYVEAKGFILRDAEIQGNLYFASEELKDASQLEEGVVTGDTEIKSMQ